MLIPFFSATLMEQRASVLLELQQVTLVRPARLERVLPLAAAFVAVRQTVLGRKRPVPRLVPFRHAAEAIRTLRRGAFDALAWVLHIAFPSKP